MKYVYLIMFLFVAVPLLVWSIRKLFGGDNE